MFEGNMMVGMGSGVGEGGESLRGGLKRRLTRAFRKL